MTQFAHSLGCCGQLAHQRPRNSRRLAAGREHAGIVGGQPVGRCTKRARLASGSSGSVRCDLLDPRRRSPRAAAGRDRESSDSRARPPCGASSASRRARGRTAASPARSGRRPPGASIWRRASYTMARSRKRKELRFLISQRVPSRRRPRAAAPTRWRRSGTSLPACCRRRCRSSARARAAPWRTPPPPRRSAGRARTRSPAAACRRG